MNMGFSDLGCRIFYWGLGVPDLSCRCPDGWGLPCAGPVGGAGVDECHKEHLRGGGGRLPLPHGAPRPRLPRGPGGRGPAAGRHWAQEPCVGRAVPPVHGHQQAVRRGGAVAECGRAAVWAVYVGQCDEFLVIDVIHEVAHSWFGNAVTNATWEEMWLSEGLATYAQRRITTETYGAAFTCLETAFRLDALHRQMKLLGEDSPVSKLQVKLEPGVNPSHLMNLFTYEKGYCFVYYLSQLCGDPQRFDDFLRAYVEKYKFTSVVAQDLLDSFLSFFPELKEQSVDCRAGLEFERWLNATGPPLAEPDLSQGSSLTRPVEALFRLWTAEPLEQAAASASAIDISKWRTFQTALFLDRLLDGSPLPQEVVMSLSKCYSSLLDSMNAEIRIRWLQIVVRNDYYPDLHRVRRFLESQMSRMYTIPLYEDLCTGALKSFALEVFYQTQGRLHPNLRRTIQQILTQGLGPSAEPSAEQGGAGAEAEGDVDTPALLLGDEAPSSAIALRDVNVSA
ncbi:aminopeptidase RNPEPL1 isoform X2 [Myotis lucifugus]|uniref:aminopeptidase RNPEPL1 isoform X2 n=1 Tax=Myotis lucifugus TaxID=59463 RepID=UPI000CCC91DB|nr:aminopeptidase RNPEPL1 isoform X2 [Myotis lucifugus]